MKVAASRSGANTADGRRQDKTVGCALCRTTVRRLKQGMASTESGVKVNCKLRRHIAVGRLVFRDGKDIHGFSRMVTVS